MMRSSPVKAERGPLGLPLPAFAELLDTPLAALRVWW